ncbi:putative tannase [Aspergillus vadensis CBS 113365]|uniref:Carboxylic ester hydrolase n=1 Tax=Aspergillus vadensis (strain CBS 113365 / IMI 142717 / IBT 24658) TaxID=1448311 RepID=A0A319BTU9_ASPVC|nr:putative tannase [Aspergillus vadensis CBS 113365]PYH66558.1 putative tannase [Aspergillus vadensis CBS 113365]
MRSSLGILSAASVAALVAATSLDSICTVDYVQARLPADDLIPGVSMNAESVVVNSVYNASVSGSYDYPDASFDYCNVTFSYTHAGLNDTVNVWYWLPAPDSFQYRYLSTGGSGYAINTLSTELPSGIIYGAVSGATDGGFGGFTSALDDIFPLENGTSNYEALYMFGYEAIHELSILGKEFAGLFFNASNTKIYSYYQSCSEGGRDGWSQVQRFGDQFDGVITGAPAIRFAFQQLVHLFSALVEKTLDYYPPPCELELIVNETISYCDPLDGRTDGVVARSDLCRLNFNMSSIVGKPYYCAASSGGGSGPAKRGMSTSPAQNGTVTEAGVEGRQVYLSYQMGASFEDATTVYDSETASWDLSISQIGAEFVTRFLWLQDTSDLSSLDNVTYDTLKGWMYEGWQRYEDSLHTTWPDLTLFRENGGKIIHYHGEADDSVPPASSVHYYESVRSVMYPYMSYNESVDSMHDWYRLYLVPGAAHCSPNDLQPNGPFPTTNLAILVDWVENGVEPVTLNATVLSGDYEGEEQKLCSWPLRPLWVNNATKMECVYDQASIDTWKWTFDAFPITVW